MLCPLFYTALKHTLMYVPELPVEPWLNWSSLGKFINTNMEVSTVFIGTYKPILCHEFDRKQYSSHFWYSVGTHLILVLWLLCLCDFGVCVWGWGCFILINWFNEGDWDVPWRYLYHAVSKNPSFGGSYKSVYFQGKK